MRRLSALVLALALAGCGDGAPAERAGRDDEATAPVGSGATAVLGSALDAEQTAWLDDVAAQGLERLAPLDAADPGADLELASAGPPPPPIEESARELRRDTPRELLASALDALSAGDVAALARLSRSPDEEPVLDEEDALEAERRFLAPAVQPYWRRVATAARLGDVSLEAGAAPDEALLRVHVGGAAGSYVIRVRKRGDGWYLAG